MAIKKTEVIEFINSPLNEFELKLVSEIETQIDHYIKSKWRKNSKMIHLYERDLVDTILEGKINSEERRAKIIKEIIDRYTKTGWEVQKRHDCLIFN